MSTLFVLLILLTGQPLVVAKDVPTAICQKVAEGSLLDLVSQPGVRSVSLMCVPQGDPV